MCTGQKRRRGLRGLMTNNIYSREIMFYSLLVEWEVELYFI
jgi:hypothetical protein